MKQIEEKQEWKAQKNKKNLLTETDKRLIIKRLHTQTFTECLLQKFIYFDIKPHPGLHQQWGSQGGAITTTLLLPPAENWFLPADNRSFL